MIIYIDRRQYVCSSGPEQLAARRTLSIREELGYARSQRDPVWVRACLRELRRLRTDFFEARMLGLATACAQLVMSQSELAGDPGEYHVEAEAMAREERGELVGR